MNIRFIVVGFILSLSMGCAVYPYGGYRESYQTTPFINGGAYYGPQYSVPYRRPDQWERDYRGGDEHHFHRDDEHMRTPQAPFRGRNDLHMIG